MDAIDPVFSAPILLGIALGGVLLLLFLIIALKLQAFIALIVVSLLVALVAGIPPEEVVDTLVMGLGSTLGSVALLVGVGAMLGRMLEMSGGAQVLADKLVATVGEKRAPLGLGIAALIFGFPIFFDAGFIVFLPIVFVVARRVGGSLLLYGLPVAGAFAVMHAFVPPHPGPVAASELIGANIGLVLVFGIVIGLPTWYLGSYLFSLYAAKRFDVSIPEAIEARLASDTKSTRTEGAAPGFGTVLGIILLPLLLIFMNTGLSTLATAGAVDGDALWVRVLVMVGSTPVALTIAFLVAMYVLGLRRGVDRNRIEELATGSLGPVAAIILITGAGGMFGAVLRRSGIGDALAESLASTGLPVIVAAFIVSTALRVAQGSATVALTTTGGIIAPVVAATPDLSEAYLALTVIAIAGGATVLSHVNDSGFWLVGRFLGMDVKTTLKTWTVMETLLGTIAFLFAFALSAVL